MATKSTMVLELPVTGSPPPVPERRRATPQCERPEAARVSVQIVRPSDEPRDPRDRRNHSAHRRRVRHRAKTLVPGMRIGPWRIESELGTGGMATVYAVVHSRFGKRAALKLAHRGVRDKLPPDAFLREARIANLIDHPSVTEVFATGTFDGRPYLTMERLAGRTLGALYSSARMSRDESIDLLLELIDVLRHAHAHGVTHRDLKLDNVFVLDEIGAGGRRVKLLDWGMACHAGEADPLRGMIAGTLTYVAPEQVRGEDITPAADIYALAVIAYQLLLGQPPFTAATDLALLYKHLRDQPPAPSSLWPEIPSQLDAVLLRMLAKRPEDRASLAELSDALESYRAPVIEIIEAAAPVPAAHRTSALRAAVAAVSLAPAPVSDVLHRPALPFIARPMPRLVSAALGVALTLAGVLVAVAA
ncbi:MAG TPA: protein kinase [Kofleriaceae bacterium]